MPSAAFGKVRNYQYAEGFEAFPARSMETLALVMKKHVWSPIEFRDSYRCKDNFIRATHIGLDFDGNLPLVDALNIWCDVPHVIGTTRHHQIEKNGLVADRLRVVFRLEKPCDVLEDYEATTERLIEKYDADASAKDGARQFLPCVEIVSWSDEGDPEPIKKAEPKKVDQLVQRQVRRLRAGVMSPDVRRLATEVIAEGGRNPAFFRGLKDLVKAGLTKERIYAFLAEQCPTQKSKDALSPGEIERLIGNAFTSAEKEIAPHAGRVKPNRIS